MSTVYEKLSQASGLFNIATDASVFESNIKAALNYSAFIAPGATLGMLATYAYYLSAYMDNGSSSELRDGMRRMIVAGLPGEDNANDAIESLMKVARPGPLADAKFDKLNVRLMQKLIGLNGICMLAGSLCNRRIVVMLLLDKASTGTWTSYASGVGYTPDAALLRVKQAIAQHCFINIDDVTDKFLLATAIKEWPSSPLNPNASAASTPAPADDEDQPATTTVSPTVTTTGVTMNAVTTIAPQISGIINSVLSNAGIPNNIESLLADSAALTSVNAVVASFKADTIQLADKLNEAQQELAAERRKAATAMPSTITLTSQSSAIPDGKMGLMSAATVFPELGGLKLTVPSFQWDSTHPDVPTVNPAYIFRKGMLISVLRCLANGDNTWLQGHTGSGKTTFIEQVAARLGWPVARVAYDSNVDRAELVGRMQLIPDGKGGTESKWLPGILERAISGGYILLCDEMDAGHPNALYTLQPLLEGKGLTLLEDGGRVIPRHPFARIVATGNTTGNGDPSGLYPACRILSAATLDRFQDFVQVPYLTEDEETKLLKSQAPTLPAAIVESIVKFGSELRKAFVSGETPISFSPRRSIAFARHVEDLLAMGLKDKTLCMSVAFRSKLYDAAPEEHRQRLLEIGRAKIVGLDVDAALMES